MKYILILLSFLIISCSAEKRISRILRHHPELLVKDTLLVQDTVIVPQIKADTSFLMIKQVDTFYLEKDRLKIRIIKDYDTLRVEGECKTDTLYKTIKVPYNQVVISQSFWFRYGNLLMFILACLIFYLLVRKMSK